MIKYIIPGLWEHYDLNIILCSLLKYFPEFFYDNIKIASVFGNFQFCSWDGGRIFREYNYASYEDIEKLIDIYNNQLEVAMRFIFTSPVIDENDLFDRYNNIVLTLANNGKNEIVVNSPILENFIRKNYPNYKLISSTTKCLSTIEGFKEELNKDYFMICADYNLNKNKKFLTDIEENNLNKNKIEFLINAICPPGCPYRKDHYYLNGLFGQTYGKPYKMRDCLVKHSTLYPNNFSNNLTIEDVFKYEENGFSNFKLEGRTLEKTEVLLNYINYMVKPEYKELIIFYILEKLKEFDLNTFDVEYFKTDRPS